MHSLPARVKNKLLRLLGMQRIGVPKSGGANKILPLPEGAEKYLTHSNPTLATLEKNYGKCGLPMASHSWWNKQKTVDDLEIAWFRGDNAYVWQTRHMGMDPATRYYLYAQDIVSKDKNQLLHKLEEDGAFGCWVYRFKTLPPISRDLLDSVNELNFLDRHLNLTGGKVRRILDIGAGYGRMAHRTLTAFQDVDHYYCTDGVATSTFLSQYYLQFRGLNERASCVPLDEIPHFDDPNVDLAINIHSFSEMQLAAIEGWFEHLVKWQIPYLFIIPNDADAFKSIEPNHDRKDFSQVIENAGYKLLVKEPVILDEDIRDLVGVNDHFFLFQLTK